MISKGKIAQDFRDESIGGVLETHCIHIVDLRFEQNTPIILSRLLKIEYGNFEVGF